MKTHQDLEFKLKQIDGKGYKAYKEVRDTYEFTDFSLIVDHVQGDPFSSPSRMRVRVPRKASGFGPETTANRSREIALRDFLTRIFFSQSRSIAKGERGLGNSGVITVERPLQEILERSAMIVDDQFVEARIFMGLPAAGRRISGGDAAAMFFRELPSIVRNALFADRIDAAALSLHLDAAEDADCVRDALPSRGLAAFVADGASLPRASGIDPRPMRSKDVVPFRSPAELKVEFMLPNKGRVQGMGIPRGVTLIVGGGYHGKSTLLDALEKGVYNHIPGDGRELAIMDSGAVKIRAADGRSVQKTDISPFINNLPFMRDTTAFSTSNASGSTSQAAAIVEALEAGAVFLLLDEDTSATNFMIRDVRMQHLVAKENEPITPFIDKVRPLFKEKGVSTILVMGGSGDYFPVADRVIKMTEYVPEDVTDAAHEIATRIETGRVSEGGERFGEMRKRIPAAESISPERENGRLKIAARGTNEILFGRSVIDCVDVEQIVAVAQTRAIGLAIHYAARYMDGKRTLAEVIDCVLADIDREGLDILPRWLTGDLARFRRFELAAAINRMRGLRVDQRR